jgi:DNA-binding transcriptional LysR family regulator
VLQIEDLQLLKALSESVSLSAAARHLNVTPPALSGRLKRLEAGLGLALAVRSARRMTLSADGERLAAQARNVLDQLDAMRDSARAQTDTLTGSLRIVAPFGFGRAHVAPLVASFAKRHPQLAVTLVLAEAPWPDKVNADVVIRIGSVKDSSWVVHPLARNQRVLCASAAYLKRHPAPTHPKQLTAHACVCIRENDEDVTLWHMRDASGARLTQRITPTLTTNDGEVARTWAEQGLGIVLRSTWDVMPLISSKRLTHVLPEWTFEAADIVALTPSRRGLSSRVQQLIGHVRAGVRERLPSRTREETGRP